VLLSFAPNPKGCEKAPISAFSPWGWGKNDENWLSKLILMSKCTTGKNNNKLNLLKVEIKFSR
jgi:hypothetical protein